MIYRRLVTPLLYAAARGDPEKAHDLALRALGWLGGRPLLGALVWRWYGSALPRWPLAGYAAGAAVVVGAVAWWPFGWVTGWLPQPWATITQAAAGGWLYGACWWVAACWWWLARLVLTRTPQRIDDHGHRLAQALPRGLLAAYSLVGAGVVVGLVWAGGWLLTGWPPWTWWVFGAVAPPAAAVAAGWVELPVLGRVVRAWPALGREASEVGRGERDRLAASTPASPQHRRHARIFAPGYDIREEGARIPPPAEAGGPLRANLMEQPDGLVEWLRAQLDHWEVLARRVQAETVDGVIVPGGWGGRRWWEATRITGEQMLADTAAKRAILELHQPVQGGGFAYCRTCGEGDGAWHSYLPWPCPTVRHLASMYADRDGFDPDWRSQ